MAPTNSSAPADSDGNQTLIISLSVVLPVVGFALIIAIIFLWCRLRRRRSDGSFFSRNVSPVDDEEIETWKSSHIEKQVTVATNTTNWTYSDDSSIAKGLSNSGGSETPRPSPPRVTPIQTSNIITHHASNSSIRKPPSLIVYQTPRASEDGYSPSSSPAPHSARTWSPSHKHSVDMVQTPVLARAPNARPGLTDESIRGDMPYVVVAHHRRQSSRLTKHSPRSPKYHLNHHRNRSSRSSASAGSLRQWYGYPPAGSPMLPPRVSTDGANIYANPTSTSPRTSAENLFNYDQASSSQAITPHHQRSDSTPAQDSHRPSLDVNFAFGRAPDVRPEDIGRAIG